MTGKSVVRRRGLTLVELLMVVAILVLLAAAILPSIQPALQNRKIREASRQVNALFSSAQARASEKGRPVGVWIERSDRGSAAAWNLFLAEVAPAYTGDVLGATARLLDDDGDGLTDSARFDTLESFSLTLLVREGDLIQFNFRGPLYPITYIEPIPDPTMPPVDFLVRFALPNIVWTPGLDGGWGVAASDDDGDTIVDNIEERGTAGSDDVPTIPPAPLSQDYTGDAILDVRLPFQIFRRPTKASSMPLNLPPGVALDLNHSGVGPIGQQFRPKGADDDQPVIIMFQPTGAIEQVYYGARVTTDPSTGATDIQLQGTYPNGPVHLLIGRTEQLVRAIPEDDATPEEVTFLTNNFVDENLTDFGNRWISVGHRNGNITTTENNWRIVPAALPTMADSLGAARAFARSARNMGGQ